VLHSALGLVQVQELQQVLELLPVQALVHLR
jgi:hypothetical protein